MLDTTPCTNFDWKWLRLIYGNEKDYCMNSGHIRNREEKKVKVAWIIPDHYDFVFSQGDMKVDGYCIEGLIGVKSLDGNI